MAIQYDSELANLAMNSKMMERVGSVPTIVRERSHHRTIFNMNQNDFRVGDIFVLPENKECLYKIVALRRSYVAVSMRYGSIWDYPKKTIKEAVKGLIFYKRHNEVKITVE